MKTLVLNSTYEPLMTLSWERAMALIFLNKVQVLESYEAEIRSAHKSHPVPAVIRLTSRVSMWKRSVRFSRKAIYLRDEYTCQYCGLQPPTSQLTLDHVIPKSKGGAKCWTNIITSCYDCNLKKANRTPEQAGMVLLSQPYRPLTLISSATPELWRKWIFRQ